MSYLVGFKVSGLAGRSEPFEIELNRDVNIFFGLNGSGKTSLLKILDSAFNNVSTSIKLVPFDSAEVVIYSEDHQSTLTRRIQKHSEGDVIAVGDEFEGLFSSSEIEYAQDYTRQQPDFEWETITSIKDTANPYKHIFLPASRSFSGSTRVPSRLPAAQRRAQEEAENEWDVIFASMLDQLWTRYSNELLSEVRNIQTRGLTNILKGVLTGSAKAKISKSNVEDLIADKAYDNVSTFLHRQGAEGVLGSRKRFVRKFTEEPQFRSVVADIDSVEREVEKASQSRREVEDLVGRMFSGNKAINFTDTEIRVMTNDNQNIGLVSLSSGEKQVLRIFIEALRADISSLLIDEPEMSLHIDWQRELIRDMQQLNPNTQLILASHSPEIMAEIPDNKIFRL